MTNRTLWLLLAGAAFLATPGKTTLAQVQAAATDTSTGGGLEEVVVTARRREEKAQTVPIAMTTFNQAIIENQDVRNAPDLDYQVPGLSFCCSRQTVNYGWIRGVPGVVSYFNDVPIISSQNNPAVVGGFFFDIDNIQVLKGPQGTLFGISTNGGALLYQPKKPTNDFEGYVEGTLGSYGRYEVQGALNVPIIDNKLLLRVGADYNHQDGFIHDLTQNKYLGDQNYGIGRISLVFRPLDSIENNLVVNYYNSRDNGTPYVLYAVAPGGLVSEVFGNAPAKLLAEQQKLGLYTIPGEGIAGGTAEHLNQWSIVNTTTWDITDALTLKNILGYVETTSFARTDVDGTPLPILDFAIPGSGVPGPTTQYSEELQALGKIGDRFNFVVGTFNSWVRNPENPAASFDLEFGSMSGTLAQNTSRTNAIYAQGTYDLSDFIDGLSFTAGYRYSWDKETTYQETLDASGKIIPGGIFAQSAVFHPGAPGIYTLSLDYQITPQTMLFVTNSSGYSTGGFNVNAPAEFLEYKPENLNNIEIGVKSDWQIYGVKARTNLSAYYGFYDNIQVPVTQESPTGGVVTPNENVASGHIEGIDGQFTIVPSTSVELGLNFAYTADRYDNYIDPIKGNLSGTAFVFTPKWKYGVNGTYHLPIDPSLGDLSVSADWVWQGVTVNTSTLDRSLYDTNPQLGFLNLNLNWRDVVGFKGIDATVFATNVLNEARYNGQLGTYDSLGIYGITVSPPAMWGVKVRYSFGGQSETAQTASAYVPPPAQPVAPAVPHSYLVFFDFNKSDLTPQAVSIVNQAAANAGPAKVTQLTVTGHTDTVGSDAYNMRLSRRRAESVAAQLEKDGIPSSEIAIVAKGKRDLLVPTADGVKEPQNRRVQIVYSDGQNS